MLHTVLIFCSLMSSNSNPQVISTHTVNLNKAEEKAWNQAFSNDSSDVEGGDDDSTIDDVNAEMCLKHGIKPRKGQFLKAEFEVKS